MESLKLGNHIEDPRVGGCLDRISSLPDELLGHVLSFLPTRFAVSTSILSTRWRYIFTLTSCLSFDDESSFRGIGAERQIYTTRKGSFKEFVYNVLGLHQISPIKIFSLVCGVTYDKSDLNAWISKAVQKGAQEIHYKLAKQAADMPDSLVMCKTLVTLKIASGGYHSIEIPRSVSLPNLKTLHLNNVRFDDCDSIQRLFSGCKLLEELSLVSCGCFGLGNCDRVIISPKLLKVLFIENCSFKDCLFEIDAPNLAYLTYSRNFGIRIIPSWKCSSSLVNAKLQFVWGDPEVSVSRKHDRENFKAAAYKTTELRLLANSAEYLRTLDDGEQMPDFLNLTTFHIHPCRYDTWKYVTSIIDKSPQLETLIFDKGFYCFYCSGYCYSPSSTSDIPLDPFSCNVQVIEVGYLCRHEGPLSLMKHLLLNASALRRVIVHTSTFYLERITKELKMLPKASKDCCIEIN